MQKERDKCGGGGGGGAAIKRAFSPWEDAVSGAPGGVGGSAPG